MVLYLNKVRQEVIEQLFKVDQPNISLSVWVNCSLPLHPLGRWDVGPGLGVGHYPVW